MDDRLKHQADENSHAVWPPRPMLPQTPKTVIVESREMLGLLTNYYLLDFLIGLILGPVGHAVCFFAVGILLEWIVPKLPVPPIIVYGSWAFAVGAAAVVFTLWRRRYFYLMSGFAASTVATALISIFGIWFISGISGGATN